jgi:hypothetical protein
VPGRIGDGSRESLAARKQKWQRLAGVSAGFLLLFLGLLYVEVRLFIGTSGSAVTVSSVTEFFNGLTIFRIRDQDTGAVSWSVLLFGASGLTASESIEYRRDGLGIAVLPEAFWGTIAIPLAGVLLCLMILVPMVRDLLYKVRIRRT